MLEAKMVSVIVPAYNCRNVIERCIKSIANQTYKNLEIIIVNDGSKDDTLSVIKTLADNDDRIKIIDKENEGVSMARNDGVAMAKGDYVQFVDADDYLDSGYTADMVESITNNNADMVVAGYTRHQDGVTTNVVYSQGACYEVKSGLNKAFYELYNMYLLNMPWNKLFKRELIKKRFDKELSLGEDLLFNLDYLKECEYIYVGDYTGYHYLFETGSSLAGKFRDDKFDNSAMLHDKVMTFAKDILSCDDSMINDKVYLMEIRYSFTNLYRSSLNKKEKLSYMKKWCSDEKAKAQVKNISGLSKVDKLFGFLYTHGMYRTINAMFTVLIR